MGNPFTRQVRTAESWAVTIERMHRIVGNFDAELRDRRSVILAKGFDGKPISVRPEFPLDKQLGSAKIYEYMLDRAFVPHDAIVHPNGLIYTVDQGLDHMVVTDPATGHSTYHPQADGRAMEYRKGFSSADQEVVGEFNPGSRHGPHSLDLRRQDGRYYVTNAGSRSIGVFNTEAREWEPSYFIDAETGANYPHTIRVDQKGIVWFTLAGSEHVGRLDPESGRIDILQLPHEAPGGVSGGTQPYGIDINPVDDRIYRFIPEEERWVVYPVPLSGSYSRDMTFTANGQVCFSNNPIPPPALEGGALQIVCIDPAYDPRAAAPTLAVSQN